MTMRAIAGVAGLALVLAACGGEKKAEGAADSTSAAAAPAPPAAAAGAVHDVNMVLEGTTYKFVPNELTIKSGDKVVYHNVSGGPHNIQFFADSIPPAAVQALDALMPGDKLGPLNGPLLVEPNVTYEIPFTNLPAGEYRFTCTPHQAMNMNGKITVQP